MTTIASYQKPSVFDTYTHIANQFQTIANSHAFVQYTSLQPQEMMAISEETSSVINQLGNLSEFYIKKTNDVSVSVSVCERVQRLFLLHNDLLSLIYKFSGITKDMAKNVKEITEKNLQENVTVYIYFDMIYQYRIILLQIFDSLRRISAYVSILKDKV
jgi:hypothetical protein